MVLYALNIYYMPAKIEKFGLGCINKAIIYYIYDNSCLHKIVYSNFTDMYIYDVISVVRTNYTKNN